MKNYYWTTEESHATNSVTLCDYVDNHMPEDWIVIFYDGSMAFVEDGNGVSWEVHAAGNGDFNSHVVRFKKAYEGE